MAKRSQPIRELKIKIEHEIPFPMIGHMIWCPHPYPLQEVQSAPGQGRNWPPHFFIASYASAYIKSWIVLTSFTAKGLLVRNGLVCPSTILHVISCLGYNKVGLQRSYFGAPMEFATSSAYCRLSKSVDVSTIFQYA